jgi:6-phospho-beta-glucosidase
MGLKLAVVGGGSTYTPELIGGISTNSDRLPVDEIVLHDIDPDRLAVVGGLADRMLARVGWPGRLTPTTDAEAALDGADFVLLQLRVGGQAARLGDETLPRRFHLIGQETIGAGGFAKALRTVPVALELAEMVERLAAPDAWIVDFTNPVGIVTQALVDAGHRAVGLCNVAIGFQRRFAERFAVPPSHVEISQVGLNHLTWIRAIIVDGVDRLPEVLSADGEELAEDVGLEPERLRRLGAVPSYYLRYYYREQEVIAEAGDGMTRAESVIEIERELLEMYSDPALADKPLLLDRRGGAHYSEAAVQLIASLHDGRGDVQVVDVANAGALPEVEEDAVVEVPARIDRDGAHPLRQAPLDRESGELVKQVKTYERLTAEAARTGDRDMALEALAANPLAGGPGVAPSLLEALLEANRRWLPRFFDPLLADSEIGTANQPRSGLGPRK